MSSVEGRPVSVEAKSKWTKLRERIVWRRSTVITAAVIAGAVVLSIVGATVPRALADTTSTLQSYDLTSSSYCGSNTGQATLALNKNLVSNPDATYSTRRGDVPGGSGTTSGTTVPDPDGVLLPDCWAVTSTILGSDPANEITSVVSSSYPGATGSTFYGGRSANDKAPTGTVTTASQTIKLDSLGDVAGKTFELTGSLGGYANQDDNTVITATWEDGSGNSVTDASGSSAVTKLGPVMAIDRGDVSSEVPRTAYGTVPAGAEQVVVTMTFTHGGAGNNDASADNLGLTIGDSAVAPTPQNYDETATCPTKAPVTAGTNLISNPGAEDYTLVDYPYGTGGGVTGSGTADAQVALPDCWVSHSDLPEPDAVVESYPTTAKTYPGVGGARLFFGGTASATTAGTAGFDPAPGFTNQVQGTTSTATQTIDVGSLNAGGHSYQLSGKLGGITTQGDFATLSATFLDATGNAIGTAATNPITEPERVADADYLAYLGGTTADSGLLPVQTVGALPAGAAKVVITLTATAISTGNDDNGVADDLNFTVDPTSGSATGQSYDLTTGTHGSSPNCPAADDVTPALDTNLIENPGAEDYTPGIWMGAPGDDPITLADCWVSSSSLPAPEAVAESYAQSTSTYPPARTSSRVFWGGTNPNGGIAGVATKTAQTIDLSNVDAAGKDFKLSALLGGYATQDDNALVAVTFQNAKGDTLGYAAIGPVKSGQRGGVSSLVQQAWYGTVPAGAAKALVTITTTAVSSGNDSNGEADDLSLVIGASAAPSGTIIETMPYTAANGDTGTHVDPGSGVVVPNVVAGALDRPAGVSATSGRVYVSNTGDNVVATLDGNGNTTVIAGSLEGYGETGDGKAATAATLFQPFTTAEDSRGDIFIADSGDNTVREITGDGRINRIAGTGRAGNGSIPSSKHGGRATSTALNHPEGLAVDAAGDVYISDTYNNRVVEVTPDGRMLQVAGGKKSGYAGDKGKASKASLTMPTGIALDAKGNLYIADSGNNVIRRVDAVSGVITTVAGNHAAGKANDGRGGFSGDGGPATSAQLNDPQGVALDGAGDLFIADTFNNAVREVAPDGTISTVVNSAGASGAAPAAGGESSGFAPEKSMLNTPYALGIDGSTGTLYIADTKNASIAQVIGGLVRSGHSAGPTAPGKATGTPKPTPTPTETPAPTSTAPTSTAPTSTTPSTPSTSPTPSMTPTQTPSGTSSPTPTGTSTPAPSGR
ncbi:hypothetical protein [Humibacter sp. RRB41]|uniref:NHL domain-containing protein n=1 Tax=Humibacter sp. RRB41 TaxID=2919946 RepID=UPI001FAAA8D0|nr:hypothetical protein [Humibacter sp. RRB41]